MCIECEFSQWPMDFVTKALSNCHQFVWSNGNTICKNLINNNCDFQKKQIE